LDDDLSSQNISSTNIIAAYVFGDRYQQQRIEAIGKMTVASIRALIPPEPKRARPKKK
jgi:hypothetical protein